MYMTYSICNTLNDNDIFKVKRNIDNNKSHDHDDITIWIIKLCDFSVVKQLSMRNDI